MILSESIKIILGLVQPLDMMTMNYMERTLRWKMTMIIMIVMMMMMSQLLVVASDIGHIESIMDHC